MRITLAELVGHHHAIPGALESCRQQSHVTHHRYIAGIAANARAALYHPKGDMRITLAELRGNHAIAGAPNLARQHTYHRYITAARIVRGAGRPSPKQQGNRADGQPLLQTPGRLYIAQRATCASPWLS